MLSSCRSDIPYPPAEPRLSYRPRSYGSTGLGRNFMWLGKTQLINTLSTGFVIYLAIHEDLLCIHIADYSQPSPPNDHTALIYLFLIQTTHRQWHRNELESGGRHPSGAKRRVIFLVLVMPFHFLALKVQLVVLVSAFVTGSIVWRWPVSCMLFFYSRCPRGH